jgi:hypothetical protein
VESDSDSDSDKQAVSVKAAACATIDAGACMTTNHRTQQQLIDWRWCNQSGDSIFQSHQPHPARDQRDGAFPCVPMRLASITYE